MRDPLLVVIKKDDVKEAAKTEIDEVAKEVIADDDCSSESSQSLREISQNTPELSTRKPKTTSITKARHIRGSTKRIESTTNEAGLKVPKEKFVKLTPEKDEFRHRDTVLKPCNTDIIESDDYLIITFKASHRQKIPKLRTSPKSSKSSVQVPKVNPKDLLLVSGRVTAIPIHRHSSTKDFQSSKTPEAATVSPIVLHGAAKESEKYEGIPNEDFYVELRDFNKRTRWTRNAQKRERSVANIPTSKKSSKLYPIKFATFLIRVPVSKRHTESPKESTLSKNTLRNVENEENLVESPKSIDVNKRLDIGSKGSEISQDSSIVPSDATLNLDPFTVNPIKFRKELRALCRSKSHDEPIMVRKKESENLAKSGAIPKSPTSVKAKKEKKSSPKGEDGEVYETRSARKRKREAQQMGYPPETDVDTDAEVTWIKNRISLVPSDVPENHELQFSKTDFEKLSFQKGILSEASAQSESDLLLATGRIPFRPSEIGALSEGGDLPEIGVLLEASAIPKISALSKAGAIPETGDAFRDPYNALPRPDGALPRPDGALPKPDDALPKPDGALPDPDVALPDPDGSSFETRKGIKFTSKYIQAIDAKTFQFRDIPVVAYMSQSTNQRNTNLKKHLKNKDPLRYSYRKFKYYKRHETSRQQNLLGKIIFDLPQMDSAMFDAQILTFRIDSLRQENCETEEGLRNRNLQMKWLMNRLVRKTMKIDSLFQSIRCNITMYTLETSASNSKANKRLDKILKLFFDTEESAQILKENTKLL